MRAIEWVIVGIVALLVTESAHAQGRGATRATVVSAEDIQTVVRAPGGATARSGFSTSESTILASQRFGVVPSNRADRSTPSITLR